MSMSLQELLVEKNRLSKEKKEKTEKIIVTIKDLWSNHNSEYKQKFDMLHKLILAENKNGIGKRIKQHGRIK